MNSRSAAHRSSAGTCLVLAAAMLVSTAASADEGGVAFWTSGQYSSLAAVPATPGWSMTMMPYYYSGKAEQSKSFQKGGTVTGGLDSSAALMIFQPGYAFEGKILGGQPYVGIGWGPGSNSTSADLTLAPLGLSGSRSDSISGGTDLYPIASLAWNQGNNNWMTYVTGDIPVGAYNPQRLANLGIGHAALDVGGGYTYLNSTTGVEFSAVLGATYNWENSDTDYKNGIDSHLDWAVSQFVSANRQVGLAGYTYYQLTGDSGSGNQVGAFKSRVSAIGPEVGYLFNLNGQQAYANLRAYHEFGAKNRLEGYGVIATISIPLGAAKK